LTLSGIKNAELEIKNPLQTSVSSFLKEVVVDAVED
jgi:hypothetical protein